MLSALFQVWPPQCREMVNLLHQLQLIVVHGRGFFLIAFALDGGRRHGGRME
jgi:hypothetical protein